MGLRYASSRHPNVVVMAPALTETAQTQNFQFASSLSLALKENIKRREVNILPDVISIAGMNGHSPSKTYSINGIVKNLKSQEFLPLHNRSDGETEGGIEKIPQNLLNHVSGLMMSNSFQEPSAAMGLQKSNKSDGDKPAEMDQMFKNLGVANEDLNTNELGQNVEEILEAITSMENNVQTGGEPIFEFEKELFDVDVMNMCVDESLVAVNKDTLIKERIEEARSKQFMIARKCEFLARRLKKLETRALGKHVADEITGLIEYSTFLLELQSRGRVEGTRPLPLSSMSLFMRQMDHAATQQASTIARMSNKQFKYFGSGSSSNTIVSTSNGVRSPIAGSMLPAYPPEVVQEMDTVAGELHTQLYKAHKDIDSDITESSSGGESADELIPYNNQYQHPLSISKRCKWRWLEDRAAVASRCTWLQSQIADLDYKIRQHSEIRRQVRTTKGVVKLEPPSPPRHLPNGWPSDKSTIEERSSPTDNNFIGGCARTRPLSKLTKRKILNLSGLQKSSKKAGRPTSLRCSCRSDAPPGMGPCAVCLGKPEPTLPRDPLELSPLNERVALNDPGFHPVLSFNSDVSLSVHYDAVMKCADWQVKASRISSKSQLSGPLVTNEDGEDLGGGTATSTATTTTSTTTGVVGSVTSGGSIIRTIPSQIGRPRKNMIPGSTSSAYQTSSDSVTNDGGLLPDHHLDLQRSKAAAHAVSVKLRGKSSGSKRNRRKNNIPLERFRHRRKNPATYSSVESEYVVDSSTDLNTTSDGSRFPSSPVPSPASVHGKDKDSMKRKRENSYDIDNIVIPYSMASATRLEKLHYKEILTPKWRFVKEMDHKNGIVRRSSQEIVEGEEDMSEETFIVRHNQAEEEERKKFLSYMKVPNSVLNSFLGTGAGGGSGRGRGHRRADSRAESFGPHTPDPMSPGGGDSSLTSPPATPQTTLNSDNPSEQTITPAQQVIGRRRTISTSKISTEPFPSASEYIPEVLHYEPRIYPLSEDTFSKMLAENSDNNHQVYSLGFYLESLESPPSVSTDSADSVLGEDPNDPEWTGFGGGKNNVKR